MAGLIFIIEGLVRSSTAAAEDAAEDDGHDGDEQQGEEDADAHHQRRAVGGALAVHPAVAVGPAPGALHADIFVGTPGTVALLRAGVAVSVGTALCVRFVAGFSPPFCLVAHHGQHCFLVIKQ